MTTKTEKVPTVEQAEADLEKAETALADVRQAVVSGAPKATAAGVAKARADVEFAELRLQLARDTDAHRADQARLARIDEIVASLTTGDTAVKARKVVDLEAEAVAAVEAMWLAAADYHAEVARLSNELARLEPLPDDITASRSGAGPGEIKVHGVRLSAGYSSWPADVLLGAVYRALHQHQGDLGRSRVLVSEALRALVGGIHDTKRTQTELLAEALADLNGEATDA